MVKRNAIYYTTISPFFFSFSFDNDRFNSELAILRQYSVMTIWYITLLKSKNCLLRVMIYKYITVKLC